MDTVRSKNSWLDGTYPFTVSIYAISFDVFCLSKVVDFKTHQSMSVSALLQCIASPEVQDGKNKTVP